MSEFGNIVAKMPLTALAAELDGLSKTEPLDLPSARLMLMTAATVLRAIENDGYEYKLPERGD